MSTRKTMVLAREGLQVPSTAERGRVDLALSRVPTARVHANYGSIVQVSVDGKHESALRTEVDLLPHWRLDDETIGTMPVERPTRVRSASANVRGVRGSKVGEVEYRYLVGENRGVSSRPTPTKKKTAKSAPKRKGSAKKAAKAAPKPRSQR